MSYTLSEHRHRFAVWAGARAAQRGFTTVENLRDALEATDIRIFLESEGALNVTAAMYEFKHREWCSQIIEFLNERGIENSTFGRAAKLVAIYLKSMIVVGGHAETSLASVAHPPIDRVLLQNLASSPEVQSQDKKVWRKIAWTQLTEDEYYALIEQLRQVVPISLPWWMLEEHWTLINE